MEKKLELRHIAPYLPYKLKVRILPLNDLYSDQITFIECLSDEFVTFKKAPDYYFQDNEPDIDFKPLLIPLSEQNTIMKWPDGEYKMTDIPNEHECADTMQYATFLMYVERHFDVFNLIDSGLALNKLTPLITQRR